MTGPSRLLEVGKVLRAHGVRGDVVVRLITERLERVAVGSVLQGPGGPLTIRRSQPYQDTHLVTFAEVPGREAAEALRGAVLRAEPLDDPDELWVHDLIGAAVRTPDGTPRGVIREVHEQPSSDILLLDTGAVVPVTFVTGMVDGVVEVDVPDGLFELFEE